MSNRDFFAELIAERGYRVGAEVGVLTGGFCCFQLARHPDLKLYAVDRWEPFPEGHMYHKRDLLRAYAGLQELAANEYAGRLILLRGDSVEMAQCVPDGELDFVFIDADHEYESVKADIEAWAPKVRRGGLISGHDYGDDDWPGVEQAVKERFGDRVQAAEDNVWMVEA